MGAIKDELDFLRQPESDELDFLRTPDVVTPLPVPESAEGGDGGGDIPGAAKLPAEAPSFTEKISRFIIGLGAVPVGKPHPAVAEAYSKANIPAPTQMFSTEDTEKMEMLFQEQQKFGVILLDAADILDKPRRVVTNSTEFLNRRFPVLPGAQISTMIFGTGKPEFGSLEDAIRKGWSGEKAVSLLRAGEVISLGGAVSDRAEVYSNRHWQLKYPRKVAEFASDMAADAAIDFGIGKALITPLRKGVIRYGTPRMADAIHKMSKNSLDKGFEAAVTKAANEAADLKTAAQFSLDDMIRESINNSPDIPPVPDVMLATADDVVGITESLVQKTNRGRRLKNALDGTEDQIIDLQIKKQNGLLQESDAIFNTDFDMDFLESKRVLLADQLTESAKDIEATKLSLKEIKEKAVTIDYKASSRDLREAYVKAHITFIDDADKIASIDHFIKLASGNTTDAIEDLTEEQFDTLLAFIDAKAKDPSNWNYLSADAPGTKGIVRRSGRRLFMNQVASPAWQVFDRLGGGRIYQFVDDATFNRYTHVQRAMGTWEMHLNNIGINPKKKVRSKADKASLRKVFLIADGRVTDIDGDTFTFDVTKGIADKPVAKESWITTVTPEERGAAEFINKEARVLSDMAVAQGRLSHTGKGAPRVIEHYITHSFDRSAAQSKLDLDSLLDAAKQIDDPALRAEAEQLARRKARAELSGIADIFQFKTAEDVNIDQFLRRIGSREGLIEDADPAFRTMLRGETNALYMQPAYQQATAMANATENENLIRYTRGWINGLRGIPGVAEAAVEPFAQDLSQLLEQGTAWLPEFTHLQWKSQDRAVRQMSQWFRAKTYFAAMGFNPGPVVTNTTQSMLTIGAIGTRSTAAGFRSLSSRGGRQALKHSRLLVGRNPLHSMSLEQMSNLSRAGGWTFRQVDHWMNVAPAFNGSLHKQIFDNPKKIATLRKYGTTEGGSFWNALGKALDAGEFSSEIDIANRVAKLTQYSYLRHDSPQFLRGPLGSMFGQFLSWPANYWNSYIPEMAKWMWTGNSPFGPLSATERATLLRHVLLAEVMIAGAKNSGIDLRKIRPVQPGTVGPLPFLFPGGASPQKTPALRILTGAAQVFTSQDDERKKNTGLREIQAGFMIKAGVDPPHFIPFFPQGLRRLGKASEAEDFRPLFFRMSEEEKQSFRIRPPGLPGISRPRRP